MLRTVHVRCHGMELAMVMQSPTDWVLQPQSMLRLISRYKSTLSFSNFTLQFLARRVKPEDRKQYDLASLRALINCSEPVRAESMDAFTAAFSSCGLQSAALQSSYAMAENVFAVTYSGAGLPRRTLVDRRVFRASVFHAPKIAPNYLFCLFGTMSSE